MGGLAELNHFPEMILGHRRKKQLLASRSHQFEYFRFRLEHMLEHELFL